MDEKRKLLGNCENILKFFDVNSIEKLNFYFIFYFIFRKFVTKNRAFGYNTSFLQQFFRFRGGGIFPLPAPGYALDAKSSFITFLHSKSSSISSLGSSSLIITLLITFSSFIINLLFTFSFSIATQFLPFPSTRVGCTFFKQLLALILVNEHPRLRAIICWETRSIPFLEVLLELDYCSTETIADNVHTSSQAIPSHKGIMHKMGAKAMGTYYERQRKNCYSQN